MREIHEGTHEGTHEGSLRRERMRDAWTTEGSKALREVGKQRLTPQTAPRGNNAPTGMPPSGGGGRTAHTH